MLSMDSVKMNKKSLEILGTRGIPAQHGGFETFAEKLSIYLVERGWDVTVYCQTPGADKVYTEQWNGINLTHIPVNRTGAIGTVLFDIKSTILASKKDSLVLTLGYNTAILSIFYKLNKRKNIINMDGIEWKRQKWGLIEKSWLLINELLGCWLGDHLIADHPTIATHLATRTNNSRITMIPYGAELISRANSDKILSLGINPSEYALVIARPEPENSILEIVKAFSKKKRGLSLIVLGNYYPTENEYHHRVKSSASSEVLFPGAIYDKNVVDELRFHARLYVHGHTVGGTNPSLVEAMGAAMPILAHDNAFNRWVTNNEAHYFESEDACARAFDYLLDNKQELRRLKSASLSRFETTFTWDRILKQYESLLTEWIK